MNPKGFFFYIFFILVYNKIMLNLLMRFLIVYTYMLITMKLMGKRQIGEMQMTELITAFFLSELATSAITEEVPLIFGLVPIILLICIEVIISFFAVKNPIIKRIFDFSPSILIDEGSILEKALLNNRLTIDELLSLLRQCGYYRIDEVRFAILEPNGQLSVVPYAKNEVITREDLRLSAEEKGFSVAIVDDGKINEKALNAIGKNKEWLDQILKKEKITSTKEIFLLSSDFCENISLKKKGEEAK